MPHYGKIKFLYNFIVHTIYSRIFNICMMNNMSHCKQKSVPNEPFEKLESVKSVKMNTRVSNSFRSGYLAFQFRHKRQKCVKSLFERGIKIALNFNTTSTVNEYVFETETISFQTFDAIQM